MGGRGWGGYTKEGRFMVIYSAKGLTSRAQVRDLLAQANQVPQGVLQLLG